MSTDAAATLTLRIDTRQAETDLELLKKKYGDLLAVMRAPATGKGVEGLGADAKLAAQQIDTLTKQVATLQAKAAMASGGMANNMKIMLRSAEMTGAASIKAGEAQIKNLDRLKAAQAAVYTELLRGDEQRSKAQASLRDLNATGSRAAERARALAAERQITQEMVAQAAARELNVTGTRAAERARALAAEKQITKELEAQAKWLALTDKQRASATVQAAKAFYGGAKQEQLPGVAGSSQALASAQARGSVAAAEAAYKSLSTATKESTASQVHWNKVANEGHAAARGLAGGLGALWLTYGSLAPLLAGAVIAGSMRQILSVGKELEFQFTMVSAISNGATVDIEKFNKAVAGTMFTPTEAAQGLRVLAQAGLEVDQALTALPSVLKLATVGETDMATAALSATSIMHAFGLSVNDMGHIGDVFAKAAAISATSVTAMMEAMKQASSVSDIFGVSMEETAASLATLANRGIEGSAAGTALRNMVKELAAPATDKAAAAMKEYGIEVFKADGSTKTLTENLQQLSEATSTMTDKSRTKFLEVLFNERGVKAANILLTDMQKMKVALDEIKMSSEGLGFMTEAQIKLSQSTEGMIKTLRSGLENTLADVFKGVAPQIKEIISALSDIAGSSEFKAFLTSTAQTVAYLTKTFLENIETVKLLGATYLAFKGISFAASAFNVLSVAVKEVTAGMRVLAAVDMTATAASMSAAAASGVQTTAALSAVAATGTKTGTVVANLAAGFSALLSPVNLAIAGIGLVVVAGYNLYKMLTGVTSEQAKAIESANQYAKANDALAKSVDAGAKALSNELGVIGEQIKLLRQGKAAADAYSQAKANAPVREAEANLAAVEAKLKVATDRVKTGPIGGGDATAESNEQRQNIRALEAITREYQDVYRTTLEIRRQTGKALDDSKKLASERAVVDTITANRSLNDQLADFKAKGDAAATALKAQTYANGVSKEAADKARERLQKQVDLRNKTEGLRSNPLSDTATQAEREARKAQIDSLLDNSFEPKGRATPVGGGSGRGALKDTRSILNDNLESGLKQEKTQLGRELIEIETALAAQSISTTVATERKNQATMASLEIERLLIEASLADAEALGDQVQVKKFQNDLEENSLKLEKQQQQALLDTTKVRTADRNAIDDLSVSISRYIDDLQFEQIALDKTAQEVTQLRIERERLRAVEDLQRRVDNNQVSPEVAETERGAIAAKAAAQMQDQEFQQSYVAGWKKAHKAYVDDATNAAKVAADSYQVMSSAIEGALDEFLTTGKLNFAKFVQSVIQGIAKIEAEALAAKALKWIFRDEGGFSKDDFANLAASFIDSAKGNVFSGSPSLHAYVNTVQDSPKTFAFQNLHGFAKGGIFAEAGPEAVMPLKRDSSGRLGVQAEGGGSKVINITVNINGNNNNPQDVRRAGGQAARELLGVLNSSRRYA